MTAIPILIFWGLAFWGLFGRIHVLLYLFFASMPFGAFAVIPSQLTGGLTLTPTPMILLLLILRTITAPGGLHFFSTLALSPKRLLWLFIFWLVAIYTTAFMPRLFGGEVTIIPVHLQLYTEGELLWPTSQNFSQLAYLSISVFAVFAFTRILRDENTRQHSLAAMCLGGAMAVLTGLLDYLNQYIPLNPLLDPFRTATYNLLTEVQVAGGKRVVGLMPEASVYGIRCLMFLSLLYFFRHAMTDRWLRERVVPALIFLLILFIWLSTSSASYVGLIVFFLLAVIEWSQRKASRRISSFGRKGLGAEFWTAWTALIGIGLVILFAPSMLDPIINNFNEMVVNKSQSSSFEERNMWTAVGWQALIDTWGLGVGLGGTRTSNSLAAILSNTGLLGGFLYLSFAFQTLMRKLSTRSNEISNAMMSGARYAYIPPFAVGLLISTTPDFGSYNSFLYGIALAVILTTSNKISQSAHPFNAGTLQARHAHGDSPL